jgi:ferredoxin-NADP reductase
MAAQPPVITQKPYVISEIIHETPDVDTIRYKAQDGTRLNFDPGMFVMITYSNPDTKEKIARAFSIASAPGSETLEFFVHMIHGRFTSHLDTAKVGDTYYMSGPYGQFRFVPAEDHKVLFIAGGTGLAPMMSMLRYVKDLGSDNDIVLIYSVRFPNEIIRKEELGELEKEIKMKLVVTVTRPQEGDGWAGETGHIGQEMIKKYAPDYKERKVYVCGPLAFTKAMQEVCTSLEIPKEMVKADVWG